MHPRSSNLALNFHVITDEGEVDSILAALITVGSTTGLVIVRLILRWGSCNKIDWSRLITAARGGWSDGRRGARSLGCWFCFLGERRGVRPSTMFAFVSVFYVFPCLGTAVATE